MYKKIKGGCQSGRKVVTHNSKSDLLLVNPNWKKNKNCKKKFSFISSNILQIGQKQISISSILSRCLDSFFVPLIADTKRLFLPTKKQISEMSPDANLD